MALNDRMTRYQQAGEPIPSNLSSAEIRLDTSMENLNHDLAGLDQELKRLQEHFDQFEGQVRYLRETEQDLQVIQSIDSRLGKSNSFRDQLPEALMQQSWEIGQKFYTLAHQTADAVDALGVEIAIQETDISNMEALLADSVARTGRIQNPFL